MDIEEIIENSWIQIQLHIDRKFSMLKRSMALHNLLYAKEHNFTPEYSQQAEEEFNVANYTALRFV